MIVAAKDLRKKSELDRVPHDRPGWYRWWASPAALKALLGDHNESLAPRLSQGSGPLTGLSYIYVGVAVKESIQARLNWHVNQHHTRNCVWHGTLSTLRQSIASLVGQDQLDEAATNVLIDQLTIEYFPLTQPIKSPEAKTSLEQCERKEMGQHVLPLNIQHNHNLVISDFKNVLKAARKAAKQSCLVNDQPTN
jgi:hypothetical protein